MCLGFIGELSEEFWGEVFLGGRCSDERHLFVEKDEDVPPWKRDLGRGFGGDRRIGKNVGAAGFELATSCSQIRMEFFRKSFPEVNN